MANLSDQQREENGKRQMRKTERCSARRIAQAHAAHALHRLASGDTPDWFTYEQTCAYRAELLRLRYRIASTVKA